MVVFVVCTEILAPGDVCKEKGPAEDGGRDG